MENKDINLTLDTKIMVKQILSTLPQMGNQINIINVATINSSDGGPKREEIFRFDAEFENFFEMLPPPRLRSLVDYCYTMALKKFHGNSWLTAKYIGVAGKTIYRFLDKEKNIVPEEKELSSQGGE